MAAGRAHALILEIDVRGRTERFFQVIRAHERRAAVHGVLLADRFGDGDPFVGLVEFLLRTFFAEDRVEVFDLERLFRSGIEDREGFVGHHGLHVEVVGRDFALREQEFFLFHGVCVFVNDLFQKKKACRKFDRPFMDTKAGFLATNRVASATTRCCSFSSL